MSALTVLNLANLFFAGLLAGAESIVHLAVTPASEALDDGARLELRKALIVRLRALVPAMFIPATLTGILLSLVDRFAPALWMRISALIAMATWIAARVVATVPLNSATVDWKPGTTPSNWKELVARAERFHVLGTWAAVLAFAFFLAAAAFPAAAPR